MSNCLVKTLIVAIWLVTSGAAAETLNHDAIRALRQQGDIVSLASLIQDAQQRYQDVYILEAQLQITAFEQLVYEIEFIDSEGTLRELYYDARSGELLAYEAYDIDEQGQLRSIEYDAKTGEPLIYEFYDRGPNGELQIKEYDAKTGQLLRSRGD